VFVVDDRSSITSFTVVAVDDRSSIIIRRRGLHSHYSEHSLSSNQEFPFFFPLLTSRGEQGTPGEGAGAGVIEMVVRRKEDTV